MLNSCCFIGRLYRDPELHKTGKGTSVTNFSLAVDRSRPTPSGEWITDPIDFVAWGPLAEKVCNYRKGDLLCARGSLEVNSREEKDGSKRAYVEIVLDYVQKLKTSRNGSECPSDASGSPDEELP